MSYKSMAQSVCKVNTLNGWDPSTWENLPAKLMFVVTEIDEAVIEFYREEFCYELADIAIRLLDALEGIWPGKWTVREYGILVPFSQLSIHSNVWCILRQIVTAAEAWRMDSRDHVCVHLELALLACRRVAECYNVDLEKYIKVKIAKNAQRGHLHGKKRKEG